MNKKKVIISVIAIVVVVLGGLLFFVLKNKWEEPMPGWFLTFNSIDELNQVRNLTKNGETDELIEFIKSTNNGENVINSKKDAKHFLKLLDSVFLPTDTDWKELSYMVGDFDIIYKKSDGIELSFMLEPNDPETFDEIIRRTSENYTDTNVTSDISAFAKTENFDDKALRIGNGVEAFSFHRKGDEEGSIRETERGFEVRLSLNVDGYYVSARVDYAPSLEAAYEILANIEFAKGAW